MVLYQFFQYAGQDLYYYSEIASAIITGIIVLFFMQKNKERESKIVSQLTRAFLCFCLTFTLDIILLTISLLNPTWKETFDFVALGTHVELGLTAIANLYLLAFVTSVFHEGHYQKGSIVLKVLQIIAAIGAPVAWFAQLEDIKFVFQAVYMITTLAIYLTLSINAFRLRQRVQEKLKVEPVEDAYITYHGLGYIMLSGILFSVTIVTIFIHEVTYALPLREYITLSIGFIASALAGISVYMGYIAPNWLKTRWLRGFSSPEKTLTPPK